MPTLDGPRRASYLPAMAILPILTAPDPRLKVRSAPVERVDAELRRLMDDMLETMYDAPGIGLAAVQVGVPKQVIVMDIAREGETAEPRCFVNPRIVAASEEMRIAEEGCLSLPEQFADVERPARVTVEYLDYDGAAKTLDADGLLAVCLQHEMDHLTGVLFVDHISKIKRDIILRKLIKARRLKAAAG